MDKKICAKCGVEKKLDEFGKSSYRKDGHRVQVGTVESIERTT